MLFGNHHSPIISHRFGRVLTLIALGLSLMLHAADASTVTKQPKQTVSNLRWGFSLPSALSIAKKLDKPVLIYFYADWCGPCKLVDEMLNDDRVRLFSNETILVRLDADKDHALAKKYGIYAFPTLIFVSTSGNELKRIQGTSMDFDFILPDWAQVLVSRRGAAMLEESYISPHNSDLLARLATLQATKNKWDAANAFLARAATEDPNRQNASVRAAYQALSVIQYQNKNWRAATALIKEHGKYSLTFNQKIEMQLKLADCYLHTQQQQFGIALLNQIRANPQATSSQKSTAVSLLRSAQRTE